MNLLLKRKHNTQSKIRSIHSTSFTMIGMGEGFFSLIFYVLSVFLFFLSFVLSFFFSFANTAEGNNFIIIY